jgi:hypothetical protein
LPKLIVEHANDGDGVAKGLEAGHWGCPDKDGEGDEHDILEDTAEGKDKARGSADLEFLVSFGEAERNISSLTRKTTETFNANATLALAKKIQRPTALTSSMVHLGTSQTSAITTFMAAQTGAK